MHRTGTSALTRTLGLLGLDLPRHLMPGIPNINEPGVGESFPLYQANDEFLASIGSAWDNVSSIAPSVFASARADAFADELAEILRAEYGESSLFVVKDPRLCRIIPVWAAALERIGARPSFVITTRNPLEVAGSLKARDGFSATKSCLLWLRYVLDAEYYSRGFQRVFVSYERLLRDWVATTDHIARELSLFWPRSDHETNLQIEEFLSSALRHHSFDHSELRARSDVIEWVKQVFEAVSEAVTEEREVDSEVFDEIRIQLNRADLAYGPLLTQVRSILSEREEQLAQTTQERETVQAEARELGSALTDTQTKLAEAQHRLESTAAEATRLGEALGERDSALLETRARLEAAEAEIESLGAQLDQARTDVADANQLREALGARKAALTQTLARVQAAESELEGLRIQLDQARAGQEAWSREAEAQRLEAEAQRLEAEAQRLEAEAQRLEAEALRAEITSLERELQEQGEELERIYAVRYASGRKRRAYAQFLSWLARGRLRYVRQYFALRRSFDYPGYLAANRGVMTAGLHPLLHYIEHGRREGRPLAPSHGVQIPDEPVAAPTLEHGASEPSEAVVDPAVAHAFDAAFYRARYPDVAGTDADLLNHYMTYGWKEHRDPCAWFSTSYYLTHNNDIREAGVNPFAHFVLYGRSEGRTPMPDEPVAAPALEQAASEPSEAVVDPAVAHAFDAAFYRARYPDVAGTDADLLNHYMTYGWKEHRDPCAWFSTSYYLTFYDDIREAGVNPFAHFVLYGRAEGRVPVGHKATKLRKGYEPTVSAIVPAFNHAPFLRQRIESVVSQDRPPAEIIILDDGSTDGTRELIEQIRGDIEIPLVVELNDQNSGNVFKQWRKGLALASGDLVWICESDHFCREDFLGRLVPYFADPSVTLAFGRIQYTDTDGTPGTWLDEYDESAAAGYWHEPRVESAYQWFRGPFGRLNVIPNVGGCLFRRQALPDRVWREAEGYSVCGDWYLYMHVAGGGRIAFDPEAVSYFRQHGANTSATSFAGVGYYRELASIASELRRRYGVDDAQLRWLYDSALGQYRPNSPDEKTEAFDRIFDLEALTSQERETRHVLMGILGFMTGGAEIFPINLANALVDRGYVVSVLVLDGENLEPGVRARLRPEIPVYERPLVQAIGLERFLEDYVIDLVHTHNLYVDLFIGEACHNTGVPLLVTLHGSYEAEAEAENVDDETISSVVENVTRFVYTADKNLRPFDHVRKDQASFTKMANAVSDPEPGLRLSRQEFGIPKDAFVFGVASRAIRSKGWDIAANALQQVAADAGRPIYLALCGDSDSYDDLLAEFGDLPGVRFLGHQTNVVAFYRMCDCCVLPTRFPGESFPFTLLESLTAGTPIIATDIGEIRTIVDSDGDAAGIVVPFRTDDDAFTAAVAAAMSRMLSERETFAHGAERLAQNYSFERLTTEYEELYADALAGRTQSPPLLTAADEVRRRVQPGLS